MCSKLEEIELQIVSVYLLKTTYILLLTSDNLIIFAIMLAHIAMRVKKDARLQALMILRMILPGPARVLTDN